MLSRGLSILGVLLLALTLADAGLVVALELVASPVAASPTRAVSLGLAGNRAGQSFCDQHRRLFAPAGPAGNDRPVSVGAVTTMSSDGFSSPPSAVQTSANERSSGGGNATVIGTGRPRAASDPVSTSVGSAS